MDMAMAAARLEHVFPKRIYSPVGGWVLTMFLALYECSYVGGLYYAVWSQYQSPSGRVLDAPWMALLLMWPAMAAVIVVGSIPVTVLYVVLRVSNLKRRLTILKRLWLGAIFGAIMASLCYAVVGSALDPCQGAAPLVSGFVISSVTVMMTISVRWLGVDPNGNAAG